MLRRRRQNGEPAAKRSRKRLILAAASAALILSVFVAASAKLAHVYNEELPSRRFGNPDIL
jgi:hypothetical protein